jgi:hypothetical protein
MHASATRFGASNAARLTMSEAITERDVLDIIGEVDPLTLSKILSIGATREELEQAACSPDDQPDAHGTEHVAELREIISELEADEVTDAYQPGSEVWRP